MRVPKIRAGLDRHGKSKFDYSNTNTTSFNFGLGQPVYGQEIVNGSTVKVNEGHFVRLASMVLPSFCRSLKYITEATFVPYENLIKTFSLMRSEKPYRTASGTVYYPKETPTVDLCFLTSYLLSKYSYWTAWQSETGVYEEGRVILNNATMVPDEPSILNTLKQNLDQYLSKYIVSHEGGIRTTNYLGHYESDSITPEGADFIIPLNTAGVYTLVCFKFTQNGRQLRKVLIGLGYKLSLQKVKKSSLPLFAYYKAYFDRNMSHRYDNNWETTQAYGYLYDVMETNQTYIDSVNASPLKTYQTFCLFLQELIQTHYYLDPDYFTVQLDNLTNPSSDLLLSNTDFGDLNPDLTTSLVSDGDNAVITSIDKLGITATAIRQIMALQTYANKSKLMGGLISEYMYVHGLGKYLEEHGSRSISTTFTDIKVSDVDVTANSSADGNLSVVGDYAGKGIGSGSGSYEFSTDTYGYFVIIGYIVPTSGFYQGLDPTLDHYDKTSFYESAFDSLGYGLTSQGEFFVNDHMFFPGEDNITQPFGYLPRYYELKCKPQNIINGDVSLPSTRNNLLPYTLDRQITDITLRTTPQSQGHYRFSLDFHQSQDFIADPSLRAVGLNPSLDNYNRIFYNSGRSDVSVDWRNRDPLPIDDNFVVQHMFDVSSWAPMLSASFSFDTDAEKNESADIAQE